MSPAGRISWAEVPVTSGHFVSPRKARTRSEDSFETKSHKKCIQLFHIHQQMPMTFHDSPTQRPRMATAAIAWGLDLFRGDLFRLHAWAAESQQVPRRKSAPGSLEIYGRSQFYSPTWPGNQWLYSLQLLGFFWGWDVIDGLSIAISRCCGAGPFLCGYCLGWLAQTPTLKNGQTRCFSMG